MGTNLVSDQELGRLTQASMKPEQFADQIAKTEQRYRQRDVERAEVIGVGPPGRPSLLSWSFDRGSG